MGRRSSSSSVELWQHFTHAHHAYRADVCHHFRSDGSDEALLTHTTHTHAHTHTHTHSHLMAPFLFHMDAVVEEGAPAMGAKGLCTHTRHAYLTTLSLHRDAVVEEGAPAMGAKGLCIPFTQPRDVTDDMKCIRPGCTNKPKNFTLFGRSY